MIPVTVTRPSLRVVDLGRISFSEGFELQQGIVKARQEGRTVDHLLLLEHHSVITLGRRGDLGHVRVSEEERERLGVELHHTNRGGDVTWHGPGQLVGYPVICLAPDRKDIVRYVRDLEQVIISTLNEFGVKAGLIEGLTGVWVGDEKIAAIGVRVSRWVTSHGFAFNICNSLEPYNYIVPCGIRDRGVTTLSRVIGREVGVQEASEVLAGHFARIFGRETDESSPDDVARWVGYGGGS